MAHAGCVVPTFYGPPCRDDWCVWESQARDEYINEADRAWASMASELCRTLRQGPTRVLVTELALNWDGDADELLTLVGVVLAESQL